MEENAILDYEENASALDAKLKAERKKYLLRIIGLIVINTFLFTIIIKGSTTDNFYAALNANLIGFNVLGFLFGTLVALFPYKGLPYKKKYLRASLISIFTFQIFMAFGIFIMGIMTIMGWY